LGDRVSQSVHPADGIALIRTDKAAAVVVAAIRVASCRVALKQGIAPAG